MGTISYERAMEGAMRFVDLLYNSNYQCQYEAIIFDICYTAFDQFGYDFPTFMLEVSQNLVQNMIPLGFKIYDLMNLANNEMDKCLTGQQYIDEVGLMME